FYRPLGHVAPGVERPSERRADMIVVTYVHRRAAIQQQLDEVRVSAVGGPMEADLAVVPELRGDLDAMLQQEIDDGGPAELAGPGETVLQLLPSCSPLETAVGLEVALDDVEPSDAGGGFQV